jgi:Holliday junction resolvase RusA-like endonuclease
MGIRRSAPIDLDDGPDDPPGTIVAEGTVPGRAVPWSAPTIGRSGGCVPTRGYRRYQAWQALVRMTAAVQRPRRRAWPYRGDVELRLRFVLRPRGGRGNPDVTNLIKAFEDALQGALIADDCQVGRIRAERVLSGVEPEGVAYQVVAL